MTMTKRERAYRIVENVVDLVELLKQERQEIAADPGSDGTAFAGHVADALLAAGGRMPGRNPHCLRWPTEALVDDPGAFGGASKLVATLLEALEYASRVGPGPDQEVRDAAEIWPGCRTKGEADRTLEKRAGARSDADAAAARQAHAARIAEAKKPKAAAPLEQLVESKQPSVAEAARKVVKEAIARVRPKAEARDGELVIPPLPSGPGRPDGEWSVGEDFTNDVPSVG